MSRPGTAAHVIGLMALIGVLSVGSASGDIITYTYDSTVDVPTGPFAVGDSGTFSLPQYDNNAWPLIFVTIEVTGVTMGGTNTFDNESDIAGWAEVSIGAEINVTSNTPTVPMITLLIPQSIVRQDLVADEVGEAGTPVIFLGYTLNADFAGADSVTVSANGASDSDSDLLGPGDDLTPFIGNGTVDWNFDSSLIATTLSNLPLGQSQEVPPTFNFTARIVYENTAPEPASLALLGLGGVLVMARRRRRRRRR